MPKKAPLPLTDRLPAPLLTACHILGVKPEDVLAHRVKDNGDLAIVVNQGQKFVFTEEELDHPKAARARLRAEGRRVLPPLDPARLAFNPKIDDGLPNDD